MPYYVMNDHLYIDAYQWDRYYLSCIDFSDPVEPYLRWERESGRAFVVGTYIDILFFTSYEEEGNQVILYSVEDPDTLLELGRFNDPYGIRELVLDGDLIYTSGRNGFHLLSAEDYDDIELVGSFRTLQLLRNLPIWKFAKIENHLFLSCSDSTIRAISVEDINNPHEVAIFEAEGWVNVHTDWESPDSNKYIIAGMSPLFLKVLQLEDDEFNLIGELDLMSDDINGEEMWINDVDSYENGVVVTYIISGFEADRTVSMLSVISLENPEQPEVIGSYSREDGYYGGFAASQQVKVVGDLVYIPSSAWFNETYIFSIEDPTQPELIELEDIDGIPYPIAIENDLMIANYIIYNIEDPTQPELLAELDNWYNYIYAASIQDGLLAVGGWSWIPDFINFRFYNARDPINPMLITEIELPESVNQVILDNGVIYVLGQTGIEIMRYTGWDGILDQSPAVLKTLHLSDPYPNPFNSTTSIRYFLPQEMDVQLSLFDTGGRLVTTLASGQQSMGSHHVVLNGIDLAAGLYLLRLEAGDVVQSRKVLLLK